MIQVIHAPLGQEHPYEQGPEERFPRQPLAGEPFVVGIVTRPPEAVPSVRVHTRLDQTPGPVFDAVRQADWRARSEEGVGAEFLARRVNVDQDVWHATLTAPAAGHTLIYWIEADGQIGPEFTLQGENWQNVPADSFTRIETQPDGWMRQIIRRFASSAKETIPCLPALHGIEWLTDETHARRVRLSFDCLPGEAFYGLGERYNALNQRGQVLDVRCYEQYKSQGKRTYMPLPFLLSSMGYGVYVDSARWMQFDLAAGQPDRWTLEADLGPDETLSLVWFTGSDPLDIIRQFSRFGGSPVLPPLWTFGLWMSGNEWNSQARVLQEVEQSLAHGIPPSVVVIEAWSDETTFYIWNDAHYTPVPGEQALHYRDFTFPAEGKWPDPKAMADQLHSQGIRLVLWQIPVLKALDQPHAQHEADRAYFEQSGFGVREADDSFYRVRPFWFQGGYLWDVTNPAARNWWLNKRTYLLDEMGIDGFKTDGGEHLWGASTRFSDGRRGDELWNLYPRLYTEAYYEFTTHKRSGDALLFSRAGFTGAQCTPAHWAGDENSTWDAYRHSILAGLSAGISGIPFWGWDFGGFSGDIPTAELYLRAAAMAAFCPIMQYHSEYNQHREPCHDRTPWNLQARTGDERVIPTFRFLVNVRHNLMPYIWQEAQHAAQTGEPMMRALALWHPEVSPYQYFFGRDLLVCPVVEEGTDSWPVTLPQGTWYDLWTGDPVQGGRTVSVPVPLDRIPVFVRAGARIPARLGSGSPLGEPVPLAGDATHVLAFG